MAQCAHLLFFAFAQLLRRLAREQLAGNVARRQFPAARAQSACCGRLVVQLRRHRAQYSVRHCVGSNVDFTGQRIGGQFLDFRRQVRRSTARQRPRQVIARQRRQRPRYRLRRLLQVAAGAVLPHCVVVRPLQHVRLTERFAALLKLLPGLRQRRRVFLCLQPGDIALRADNVHRLSANLPNQLRLLEPLLLLLLVEYRADAAGVGVIRITV